MLTLDLHGMDVFKATAVVINKIYEFEENEWAFQLNIICGKGTGALRNLVEDILERETNYAFEYDERSATFWVKK
ncbi:Smr/MutS family protein [Metamycoplasma hyosynoviae]|uniref:Smr/MutS family protein n=1 Tax=Metamycoplasma hyosynoviae TaxID=29559 RepID=UPI002358205B|nr:Smr/MutS family protein [Metamycoplasma hyosynoviae]MDC8911613.1 Smr/MutS family protein [Metamycoplasma hyosynoviae]MDC8913807.1 Smr/MutS family protein [Metamycoplasma hyosynoviae]MDC8916258.1 Smr/MutS family protein [Metamycoplasma hyosynoviae]MDC8919136.1 Smr/MutS family protein [Metamycoplasma hyosynoviae]MDC8919781.1 Smr/MutS family protein [Metamycoplasma hyosynoviae]